MPPLRGLVRERDDCDIDERHGDACMEMPNAALLGTIALPRTP